MKMQLYSYDGGWTYTHTSCFSNREGISTVLLGRRIWEESFVPLSLCLLIPPQIRSDI